MQTATVPTDAKKLVVIGAVSKLIDYHARRTHVESLALDTDDLRQEGMLKVLRVIDKYPELPAAELIPLVKQSLSNLYAKLVRIKFLHRNSGIVVDLSAAFDQEGQAWMDETYIEHQVQHLCSMLDSDAQLVLKALVFPDPRLVEMAMERTDAESSVSIPVKVMAEFLGMTRNRFRRAMAQVEEVAQELLVPQTA